MDDTISLVLLGETLGSVEVDDSRQLPLHFVETMGQEVDQHVEDSRGEDGSLQVGNGVCDCDEHVAAAKGIVLVLIDRFESGEAVLAQEMDEDDGEDTSHDADDSEEFSGVHPLLRGTHGVVLGIGSGVHGRDDAHKRRDQECKGTSVDHGVNLGDHGGVLGNRSCNSNVSCHFVNNGDDGCDADHGRQRLRTRGFLRVRVCEVGMLEMFIIGVDTGELGNFDVAAFLLRLIVQTFVGHECFLWFSFLILLG